MIRPTARIPEDRYPEELKHFDRQSVWSTAARKGPIAASASPASGRSDPIKDEFSSSDAYLVSQCLKGNENAWATLIDKYKRLIYSIPMKYGTNSADAADIFQSVCMQLFCDLSKLRKAESLKSWLIVVTARKCFQWKKQRRAELTLDNLEEEYPEAVAVHAPEIVEAEKEQCLREGVAQLPPRCRELVHLLFYEQPPLPYAEVARRLRLATGSIGFIRGRCLERLHKVLMEMDF
jgi:RNA polymerase sigma factor (sigma-70 family)